MKNHSDLMKGVWNLGYKCKDVDETTRFYVDTLGAELRISSVVLGCVYNLIRLGDTRILLFDKAPYEEPLGWNLPCGFLHVVWEVEDFDLQIDLLRQAQVDFLMGPQKIEGEFGARRFAFFEDLDGVRTEVMQILSTTGKAD